MPEVPVPLPPRLVPGVRVVPRGRDRVQVGLVDERAVVLRRDPTTDATLEALLGDAGHPDERVVAVLAAAGLLHESPTPSYAEVEVHGDLGVDPAPLLATAGLAHRPGARVVLRLGVGEPAREDLDPLLREGRAHLVVRAVDGVVVLGPFVAPGHTACLRCLDAHRADEDPEHPAVLERYVRASARPRTDGVPDGPDPLTGTLITAWAAYDLAAHARGLRPSTWSTTLTWDLGRSGVTARTWLRHPRCACAWSGTLDP